MQLYLIIKEQEASQQTVENCQYCFENAKRHLIVSIGKYVTKYEILLFKNFPAHIKCFISVILGLADYTINY